jgi:hypothetical protein
LDFIQIKHRFLYAALIFTFLSCRSTPPPPSLPVTIPDDFFGMVHAGNTETPEEYALLDEMGVEWILYTFYWHRMEPEKNKWTFDHYDSYVDKGKAAGKKIIAVLAYDASWLYSDGERKRYVSPENLPHFLTFVEETVKHFRGRVDAWEIWNEPNFMFWNGSNEEFFALSKQAALTIKKNDPDAEILGGAFWRVPKSFIRGMFKTGALDNVSGLAFHPYAINPRGSVLLYDKLKEVLEEEAFTKPVWITEVGYPTAGWYPTSVSEDEFPAYIVKTIAGLASRGARTLLWYQMFDPYNKDQTPKANANDSEKHFGLVYPDYTRKKGAHAYSLCARYIAGMEYRPDLIDKDNIPDSIISFYFTGKEKNNTLLLWNDKKTPKKIKISLANSALLHDVSTGENVSLANESELEIGPMPVIITWVEYGGGVPRISLAKQD